uniref:LamG-like jellyroll fold domain-containing protein n=1 Tax=Pseudoruegeria sp. HB172150 TaxID=2721164 RepID=UPI0027384A9F
DALQQTVFDATGMWASETLHEQLAAYANGERTDADGNTLQGPDVLLTEDEQAAFQASLRQAFLGELNYVDGGSGFDILKLDGSLMDTMASAYKEAWFIDNFANGLSGVFDGYQDAPMFSAFIASQIRTGDFLNPFGQTLINDIERIEIDLTYDANLATVADSEFTDILSSPQLTGESSGDDIGDRTWFVRDYNNMVAGVLNTTDSHTEFVAQVRAQEYRIGSFIEPGFTTEDLLQFDPDHLTPAQISDDPIVQQSYQNWYEISLDDWAYDFLVEYTAPVTTVVEGTMLQDTVIVQEMQVHFDAGYEYTFRFDGGIGSNGAFKAIVVIGDGEPILSNVVGDTFTFTTDLTGYETVKFIVQRGGEDFAPTQAEYGLSVKGPGASEFVTVGTPQELLVADSELGYSTRGTIVEFASGTHKQGHEGELSGTLEAHDSVTYTGEIYLEANRAYQFIEHSKSLSVLTVGGEEVFYDTSAANDQIGLVVVSESGYYSYSFTATNDSGAAADYALAINTVSQNKFLVMKGETGAPSVSVSAEGIAVGVNIIGDNRSEEITGTDQDDLLMGQYGHDLLDGGLGNDIYVGGQGIDTFVLGKDTGHDVVFETNLSDFDGDIIQYEGDLSELTIGLGVYNDLILKGGDTASITIAEYYNSGNKVWVMDKDGDMEYVHNLSFDENLIMPYTFTYVDIEVMPGFVISQRVYEYNTDPFFLTYMENLSSDMYKQARESFLEVGEDFDSGGLAAEKVAEYLGSVTKVLGDVSLYTAETLDLLTHTDGVSRKYDAGDGDVVFAYDGSGSSTSIDLAEYFFSSGDTDVGFTFAAYGRFDDLMATNLQRLFQVTGSDGSLIQIAQVGGPTMAAGKEDDIAFRYLGADGKNSYLVAHDVIVEGEWAHWGATIDADGFMTLYKDGEVIATKQHASEFAAFDVDGATVGSPVSGNASMTGEITDFVFRNDVLDGAEMRASSQEDRSFVNSKPVVDDFVFTMQEDEMLITPDGQGLLSGASDADGDMLTLVGLQDTTASFVEVFSAGGRSAMIYTNSYAEFMVDLGDNFLDLENGETDTFTFVFDVADIHGESDQGQVTITVEGESDYVGEWGDASVNHNWATISFSQAYENPIVVAFIDTYNGGDFAEAQIQNVTATGFEVRVLDSSDYASAHYRETVSYIVLEEGEHTLIDGTVIYAGQVNARAGQATAVDVGDSFYNPLVFSSVVGDNVSDAWVSDRIGGSVYETNVWLQQEVEARSVSSATVNYFAVESGNTSDLFNAAVVGVDPDGTQNAKGWDVDFAEIRTMPDASSDLFYGDPAIVRFDEDAADNNRLF